MAQRALTKLFFIIKLLAFTINMDYQRVNQNFNFKRSDNDPNCIHQLGLYYRLCILDRPDHCRGIGRASSNTDLEEESNSNENGCKDFEGEKAENAIATDKSKISFAELSSGTLSTVAVRPIALSCQLLSHASTLTIYVESRSSPNQKRERCSEISRIARSIKQISQAMDEHYESIRYYNNRRRNILEHLMDAVTGFLLFSGG